MIAAFIVLYLYAFWVAYIAIMGAYRAHLAGRLVGVQRVLAVPLVVIGFALDCFAQYTIATLFFFDAPEPGDYLVTARLKRYMRAPDTWRGRAAQYICDNLLDPFDPTGDHC